jgi:hypothetical protein
MVRLHIKEEIALTTGVKNFLIQILTEGYLERISLPED